ncbi:MAG: glutamate racemase [Gammaproteobacteria bacterium]|nr:MAG: glutamate racemase [Gammaproteobacteria bacterium]TDJ38746.1 MAG: glutamate racemase [Gammaproteobacteria bacterium]
MSEPRPAVDASAPIGVFDSGVGGLTVLKALQARMPAERFVYLGDTARLPYGTKSARTVQRYAVQAAGQLVTRGVKALVVACNTASAVALVALREAYQPLPVFGVVDPGAAAAGRVSRSGRIGVLATESTVRGGAYQHAILNLRRNARVFARACPMLVTLAEDGWIDGDVPERIVSSYLGAFLHGGESIDTLLLGCTHFPILRDVLARVAGAGVTLVDSAETTAQHVATAIERTAGAALEPHAARLLLATDDRHRFARVGRYFLGEALAAEDIELIDL